MKQEIVCVLEITTWQGMSLGATHYYGSLKGYVNAEYKSIDVSKAMTAGEARKLGIKDKWEHYKAGAMTTRFDTRQAVIKAAIKQYKTHFPDVKALACGHFATVGPWQILVCDNQQVADVGNKLYDLAESIGWWDHKQNQEMMDSITRAWDVLIEALAAQP